MIKKQHHAIHCSTLLISVLLCTYKHTRTHASEHQHTETQTHCLHADCHGFLSREPAQGHRPVYQPHTHTYTRRPHCDTHTDTHAHCDTHTHPRTYINSAPHLFAQPTQYALFTLTSVYLTVFRRGLNRFRASCEFTFSLFR